MILEKRTQLLVEWFNKASDYLPEPRMILYNPKTNKIYTSKFELRKVGTSTGFHLLCEHDYKKHSTKKVTENELELIGWL